MLPIVVDLARTRVVLAGEGAAAYRRLTLLDAAGAAELEVYAPEPIPALAATAGGRLRRRWPDPDEVARAQLVFLAAVAEPAARRIRRIARVAGVLLNAEDDAAHCDFHSASVMRRGDLTVAVSTGGRSPGLAAAVRRDLEQRFGPEWEARLERGAALRTSWRAAGADRESVAGGTSRWLAAEERGAVNALPDRQG
jgi:precorrin-2 dehydrogenase